MRNLKDVDRNEVYRYMGMKDSVPDGKLISLIDNIINELSEECTPMYCVRDTGIKTVGMAVQLDFCTVYSEALSKHLTDCCDGYVMAATIGAGADRIISKYSELSSVKAVAAQAAASAMIEQYADDICEVLKNSSGMYLKPRFSPGYGDFPLDFQDTLLTALDARKRIGLCLTGGGIMTPVKSVTAIVGKTVNTGCNTNKCHGCSNTECAFRMV